MVENSKHYSRVVVKIGSSTLTHSTGHINIRRVEELVKVLSDVKNSGCELIVVSSGAVAVGVGKLGLKRPCDMPTKQAAASVGQCELMYLYDKLLAQSNHTVSQVLLTRDEVEIPKRNEHIVNTMRRLLELGVIPIVNENDTVSVEEIEFGDNDTLSAIVSSIVEADLLILMSDIDGLYDKDPHKYPDAKRIYEVNAITDKIRALAGSAGSSLGTGGMITKIAAAQIAMQNHTDMVIINGERPQNLYDVMEKKAIGTWFVRKG